MDMVCAGEDVIRTLVVAVGTLLVAKEDDRTTLPTDAEERRTVAESSAV